MQGAVLMPHNPQQGFSPPTGKTAADMHATPSTDRRQNDSGVFSAATDTSAIESTIDTSKTSDGSDTADDDALSPPSPDRKYVCPICDRTLTSQHEFTLHIRSHNNEELEARPDADAGFPCRICLKVLSSGSSLDRHVLVHSGERPFHCKRCGDTFTTNGNMHRHMRTHCESDGSSDGSECNNNRVDRCPKKRKIGDRQQDEEAPKKTRPCGEQEETAQTFRCPVCDRADFNTLSNLDGHLEDNHPDYPAKCTLCRQVFLNNKQLIAHRASAHEPIPAKNPVTGFKDLTFVDFSSEKFPLIARTECELNLRKVTGGLRFPCSRCSRPFPCPNSLDIHERGCAAVEPCDGLDLSSISRPDIRRTEFFSRLNLLDTSPEKCPPSDERKPQQKLREQLSRAMDGSRDLADIQSILSNINLQHRMQPKRSASVAPEAAAECPRGEQEEESQDFFAVEFRKMKLRGEFPCRLCSAVFPNLRALKGHNRTHLNGTANGTYHCNMCPHSSADKAALIRHMRTHNGDRPYECSLCNYAFTTKANCERHLRNRHAKTSREEVKKSIIYHPSEDPTNDDLNRIGAKEEGRKMSLADACDATSEKVRTSTPKITEVKVDTSKANGAIPNLQTVQPVGNVFGSLDVVRTENLRSMNEQSLIRNELNPLVQTQFPPASNIKVKSLEVLKESRVYEDESDEGDFTEEEDQPMDLVLDLSKKKTSDIDDRDDFDAPQDLTKKTPPQPNIGELFAQQLLKAAPKIDPTAVYATQLAHYYRNFQSWPGFPFNSLLFPPLQAAPPRTPQDIKEKMQRFQLCGGSMVAENLGNRSVGFDGYKFEATNPESNFSAPKKPVIDMKPLSLNVADGGFGENLTKLHSPIAQCKPDPMQSPNSVKMVIKNGVLMPKQKQRRYRTERPFTCEHCSARFTLRSNMERHIKQQHPQFWSQRQRGGGGGSGTGAGRKPHHPARPSFCDLSIPSYEAKAHECDGKEYLNEKIKYAILAQHLKAAHEANGVKKEEEEEDCELIIDENDGKAEEVKREVSLPEEKFKPESKSVKEESQDLVPVSRLLDNASQQPFKDYFKGEEQEIVGGSEEDEEGLVASGSTSEGNVSGTDENRSESETVQPVKKKSAYSLAPNRVCCPYCNRKFPWTSSLRRHILTHTGQKPFKCSHCPLLFTTKSNCDRHLLRKHGNAATTVTNDHVLKGGNGASGANYLMRNVPERPFKCSNCPSSTFSTYLNLKKHMGCKHKTNAQGDDIRAQGYEAGSSEDEKPPAPPPGDWERQLALVSRPGHQADLQQQQQQHSDLPFKCHLCEGSFSERHDALDHIRDRHASEYDLLMSKNALEGGNATTPDEAANQDEEESEIRGKFPDYSNRKVICAFCMRRFWSAEDLRRHMRTHTGERPFSCDICRRRFTLKHSMLRHRKKHNVSFGAENDSAGEDGGEVGAIAKDSDGKKTDDSDGNEGGDLISNLLGLKDPSIIDKVLTASVDNAAKLLGVRNGVKE